MFWKGGGIESNQPDTWELNPKSLSMDYGQWAVNNISYSVVARLRMCEEIMDVE